MLHVILRCTRAVRSQVSVLLSTIPITLFALDATPLRAAPSAEELLEKYDRTCNFMETCHIEYVESLFDGKAGDAQKEASTINEVSLFHDRLRWRSAITRTSRPVIRGSRPELKSKSEYLIDTHFVKVQELDRPKRASAKNLQVSADLDINPAAADVGRFLQSSSIVFGRLHFDKSASLSKVMREAGNLRVSPKMEVVDGVETWHLAADGKSALYSLWLDPDKGFLPRRVEIRMPEAGEDRLNSDESEDSVEPQIAIWRYDAFRIETRDDRFYVDAFDLRCTDFRTNTITGRAEFRMRKIDFAVDSWPADSFAVTLDVPNGTSVLVKNEPRTKYEWQRGKIVKRMN